MKDHLIMGIKNSKPLIVTAIVLVAIVAFIVYQNQKDAAPTQSKSNKAVVIAYQTGVDPTKVAQANSDYERNSNQAIQWRKFDAGSDVVNALASGDVVIGNIGSSPLAAAASRDLPIEVFLVTAKLGGSEALVVSNKSGIKNPQDLIGKTIAVPFVSTTHYSLLSALKHWNIADNQVKIINLRPPEITAAWERGDIDATYVWEPALSKVKASGHVLTDSKQVGEWGAPTYDLWVVRKDFAEKNPEFLKAFVQTSLKQVEAYQQDPKAFEQNADNIQKIAQLTGSDVKDIPLLLSGNIYLDRPQQQTTLAGEFAKNIFDTATFLKSQGKVDQVKPDYQENVTTNFLQP
ncbi:taurine ABC transporter substrate-binding protein [Acinetobacter sp. NIPH 1958]|uniref:taurine ABC transporter substrate-binding protein n=1 Tax=unclassified Acinetobacter TaxID=196816 RepID=UPI001486E340|nr:MULTISPECIES: taurine ABC transporter substrate-binding protein [unclassified Acinetobacter]MCH7352863.1 taurine ABC transporter substrate-binding protein [Acinetobacter sp. NIPH 2023]MCH7354054.1 taurine ABC transporter substrate-binding protein [Acinetobacter sp. NIPH 1958]MCH7360520.1 taurine ABC transporter substrate-binding protein [Acinetobacter sp. NIPH 2024]